jgi:hypothetical protein
MRKLIFLIVTALLALPAVAVAGSSPSPASQAAAVKQCRSERTLMGLQAFKALYATNATKSNAFGKCVSKLAQQNEQEHSNAAAQCRAERSADSAAFAAKYGAGPNHRNAFGTCVSTKAKAAAAARVEATVNAAKACLAERQADSAAFKTKYGAGPSHANAFGKCVSSHVKHA